MKTKRVISIVAGMVMVLSLTACGGNDSGKNEVTANVSAETTASAEENVQIANPWTECSDIKEAEEDNSIHLRKGVGTEDISGDYNVYSESNQVDISSYKVTMQGNNGSVSLATWTM